MRCLARSQRGCEGGIWWGPPTKKNFRPSESPRNFSPKGKESPGNFRPGNCPLWGFLMLSMSAWFMHAYRCFPANVLHTHFFRFRLRDRPSVILRARIAISVFKRQFHIQSAFTVENGSSILWVVQACMDR